MPLYHIAWKPGTGYGSGTLSGTGEPISPDAVPTSFKRLQSFAKTDTTEPPLDPASPTLTKTLAKAFPAKEQRPVTIMVHGFNFNPSDGGARIENDSPYAGVYAPPGKDGYLGKQYTNASWLPIVGLGPRPDLTPEEADPPVIAFAWDSQPDGIFDGSLGWSNFYEGALHDHAPAAARGLAAVVDALVTTGRRVRFLAHSLGTRTVLRALDILDGKPAAQIERCLFMAGAQYSVEVKRVIDKYPKTAFINIGHRKDFILTELGQKMDTRRTIQGLDAGRGEFLMRTIGARGLAAGISNWLDLQCDGASQANGQTLSDWFHDEAWGAFNADAYDLDGVQRRLHFAVYTWPANKPVLHRLLTAHPHKDPLATWRALGIPEGYDYPGYSVREKQVVDPRNEVDDPPIQPGERLEERRDLIEKYRT